MTHFWHFGTPNISETVKARNFKFDTETKVTKKSKTRMSLLLIFIAKMSLCSEVISSFVIFAVLDL